MRKFILKKYSKDVPFDTLVVIYRTDGLKDLGDTTGWFTDGEMAKEFSEAVWLHQAGEVFTLGES